MSTTTLIVLSAAEAVALVAVLAGFLLAISARLTEVARTLRAVSLLVQGVGRQVAAISPRVEEVNVPLRDIAGALPAIAAGAELLESRDGR